MRYEAELERILTEELFKQEPGQFASVEISDGGDFAVVDTGDKRTRRELSSYAKKFLQAGGATIAEGNLGTRQSGREMIMYSECVPCSRVPE